MNPPARAAHAAGYFVARVAFGTIAIFDASQPASCTMYSPIRREFVQTTVAASQRRRS